MDRQQELNYSEQKDREDLAYGSQIPAGRSYVQAHQVHSDLLATDQAEFEAISVIEFDSLREAGWLAFDRQYYE